MADKITKQEAVRRSLAKLGSDAMPVAIQKDIKETFGIDMTTGHISTTKGQLRRAAAGDATPSTPKPQAAEMPLAPGTPATGKITKVEAVRRSLEKLGKGASTQALQADVRERFGFEMSPEHVRNVKRDLIRKGKGKKKATALKPATPSAEPAASISGREEAALVGLVDILTLKGLVDRVGAEDLKTLIDAMTR